MVRPVGQIDVVRHEAIVGREGGQVGERAGLRQRRRERCAGNRRVKDASNHAFRHVGVQHIPIGRIDAERGHAGVNEDAGIRYVGRNGAVITQRPDVPAAVVAEHVGAGQLRNAGSAIHHAAGDRETNVGRARGSARIVQNRVNRTEAGGRRARTGALDVAFPIVPAVIAAFLDDIHFLARALADVADVEPTGQLIEREAPRIAQAHRPKLRPHVAGERNAVEGSGADEWVVRQHGVIRGGHDGSVRRGHQAAGLLIHVEAHDGGEEILVDALAVHSGVIGVAFVAE